jgi:hypothetical protein
MTNVDGVQSNFGNSGKKLFVRVEQSFILKMKILARTYLLLLKLLLKGSSRLLRASLKIVK